MNKTTKFARDSKQLGNLIRSIRKENGLTQTQLAEKVNLRQATISDIENGQSSYTDLIFKILNVLGVQVKIEKIAKDEKVFDPAQFYNE